MLEDYLGETSAPKQVTIAEMKNMQNEMTFHWERRGENKIYGMSYVNIQI